LALLSVILGGFGWVLLLRTLGAPAAYLFGVAIAYPWMSFIARIYLDYKNDHWACAIAPWIYLATIQIPPLAGRASENVGKIIGTGFLAGIGVSMKYSMAPFLMSSILYFVWLDGLDLSRARIRRMFFFGVTVISPSIALFVLNRTLTDRPVSPLSLGAGLDISPLSNFSPLSYFVHFIANTLAYPAGLDLLMTQLDIRLLSKFGLKLLPGTLFVTATVVLVLWVILVRRSILDEIQTRLLAFLLILTITLWIFLVFMNINGRFGHDYVSDPRLYMPVGLGWLALCGVILFSATQKDAIWGIALASILIPASFSFLFFFLRGVTGEAFAAMPRSQTAWIEYDPHEDAKPRKLARQDAEHASFLANLVKYRGKGPDLLVAPEGRFLTELAVPCFYTFRAIRDDGHFYYSSRKLEVWAMVPKDKEGILVKKFRRASSRERIDVLDKFPYVVYIFYYEPEPIRAPASH
jgi:hypothetical protein